MIPERTVLVDHQHDVASGVEAGQTSGVRGEHERQQAGALRLVGHQGNEHATEPDRLLGEIDATVEPAGRRVMGDREHRVDDGEHRRQPVGQLVRVGHAVGDSGAGDLALRAADALADRRLGQQEHAGDLGRRQPADRAQGEGDLRLARERRVTAREQQPQAIVTVSRHGARRGQAEPDVGRRGHADRAVRGPLVEQAHGGFFARSAGALAPQPVDRLATGNRGQPGTRPVGNAVAPPRFGGGERGVLQGVLGDVDVAREPDEGGQHLATLHPDQLGQRVDQPAPVKSITGRTSTRPSQAPGICAAQCSASSRSLQSSR